MPHGPFEYHDGSTTCEGYLAIPEGASEPRPCVLVAHQWAGLSEHEEATARDLADQGYVALALDVYGKGVRGGPTSDNAALMNPWISDRAKLRTRLLAAVSAAETHKAVNAAKIAVIGYCFGGLCALDLARSGDARIKGAVSIHGVFAPPGQTPEPKITASILVLHGYADPMAKPADMLGLADELTRLGADWQIHAYGHAMHAFTAEGVNMPDMGLAYDAKAARRSREARNAFLKELFSA